jgi:hypothetical protein
MECRRVLEKIFDKPFKKARPRFLRNNVTGNQFNLELDCYNEDLHLAVEYDGIAHFKYTPYFHKNKEAFYCQKYRDNMKDQLCKENKFTLWGFYPVCNAFFMKGEPITKDLRFIVGGTMGFINKRKYVSLNFKEDYEYTLMCYKEDGGVIRFNRICVKHNVASSKGGIGKDQQARLDDYKKAAQNLMKRFPGLVHMNKQRDGEILLRDKSN